MSTRGPQRFCPHCSGQVYFHHTVLTGSLHEDVWYCQGCGKEIQAADALAQPPTASQVEKQMRDRDRERAERKR